MAPALKSAHRTSQHARRLRTWVAVLLAAVASLAWAQVFSAERYYLECLRFEVGGDLTTARQSCLSALEVDGERADVQLALGRIEFALGELSPAETRLQRVRPRLEGPEVDVLLAEIVVADARPLEAEFFMAAARGKLAARPDLDLAARLAYLEGRVAQAAGEIDAAFDAYQRAIDLDGLSLRYRLADAELRWRVGDLALSQRQLRAYEMVTSDDRAPAVKSLLGRIAWADGRADEAVGLVETALALRDLRDSAGQAADLRVLAALYYGQADLQRGGLALREATLRGNLLGEVDGNTVLWLLAMFALLALHLVGEARRGEVSVPLEEGAKRWTVGGAYSVAFASALLGLAAALVYGVVVHGNLLALLTPHQQHEARAVYLIVFAATAALLSWQRTRALGWNAGRVLVGRSDGLVGGVVLGALVYAVMLGYLIYVPRTGLAGPFFLDLAWLTPLRVAALAVVPFAELFFRGVLRPAVQERYGEGFALPIVALAWALAFATPLAALIPLGFVLAEVDRRHPSGLVIATALWIAWVGLAATVVVSPYVRALFL